MCPPAREAGLAAPGAPPWPGRRDPACRGIAPGSASAARGGTPPTAIAPTVLRVRRGAVRAGGKARALELGMQAQLVRDPLDVARLVAADEGHGLSGAACATGAARAMHVALPV